MMMTMLDLLFPGHEDERGVTTFWKRDSANELFRAA
jgi:hypothetical protein